jgi:hypothetical protein
MTELDQFFVEDDSPAEVYWFQHVLDICNPTSCEHCGKGVPRERPQTTRKPD